MLAITRRALIKDILTEKKSVTVTELATLFAVTNETIRRDFIDLENEGFLTKTYGGAFIQEGVQNDIDVNLRKSFAVESKIIIAEKAAHLIRHGDTFFLDSSTTSHFIAQKIKDMRVTVVTNSLLVSNVLSTSNSAQLILAGGIFKKASHSFVGRTTISSLHNYFFDRAFISCRSVSMSHGITDSNEQQAEVREMAANRSNQVCLVADYSKFNNTSFTTICPFEKITHLAVDKELPEEWINFLDNSNVTIL